MPQCKKCGNRRLFGSSKVPSVVPYTNGPVSGIIGHFHTAGEVETITSMGVDKEITTLAFRRPEDYFDLCLECGSPDLEWSG